MSYYISRNQQSYGPYSLEDLQRYVASGQIAATDLAQGEGMPNWIPVSQILAGGSGAAPIPPVAPTPPTPQVPQSYSQPQQPGYVPPQQQGYVPPQQQGYVPPQQPGGYGQPQQGYVPPQQQGYGQQAPAFGQAGVPNAATSSQYPPPPDMNWVLLLVLSIVTCGIFYLVWMFIQAAYVSKIDRDSKAMMFYAIGLGCSIGGSIIRTMDSIGPIGGLINLAGSVMIIMANFKMKASLEGHFNRVEPVNLQLNGVMTFFFATIYFQYHFNRINNWRRTGIMQ